jgi:predicted DNA binding protein
MELSAKELFELIAAVRREERELMKSEQSENSKIVCPQCACSNEIGGCGELENSLEQEFKPKYLVSYHGYAGEQ